jgi:transposase
VPRASVWKQFLGLQKTTITGVWASEGDDGEVSVVIGARPTRSAQSRCPYCWKRCPGYDQGVGRRRWRAHDAGLAVVFLEAEVPRVSCREHGVVVALVPWARHDAGHTLAFDDQVAWLATHAAKSTVSDLMRIAWRTVGAICARVWAEVEATTDRFAGLRRIGIDEISYKRGHKYLTIVVDHDTRRLLWAADGRSADTLRGFFDALGTERSNKISHVSADAAEWIAQVVAERCPNALLCADPFHIVKWATDALDQVRREHWNTARGGKGKTNTGSKSLKRVRWALWKNPEDLTDHQHAKLAWIEATHPRLYRAYLLKEGLRTVFALAKTSHTEAIDALDRWIAWARRCRIPAFVALSRSIVKHRDTIIAAIEHRMSNGLIESMNTKIRVITRMAYGFANPDHLIALAMLSLGGHCPPLPGRK